MINYTLKAPNEAWDVIAIIRSSDGKTIDSIDEIYYDVTNYGL